MCEVPTVSQAERSPLARRRKKWRKHRAGNITPMSLRRSLFSVAPATPAGSTSCKPPAPATRPFRVFTNHETRITAFMLLLTRPFLDIPGFLPPENGSLPRENGFLPPDDDFLPNLNESITRYSPQFVGIRRNSSDNPPSRCQRSVRRARWQPVVKPRVAPRAARIAPLMAPCPADKERPGSILDIFDRGATQFRRDASPLECSGAFAAGCRVSRHSVRRSSRHPADSFLCGERERPPC